MHSTELMIIIPLLIVLILTTMMMLYFSTVLGQVELDHSRVFMMSLSEESVVNQQVIEPYLRDTIRRTPLGPKTHTIYLYQPRIGFNNPFAILNRKPLFKTQLKFKMTSIDRKWVSIINSGLEDFLQKE